MPNVKMDSLRQAAQTVKRHAEQADKNQNGVLTAKEIKSHGQKQQDEFVTGDALKTMESWAKVSNGNKPATVAQVQAKADQAIVAIEKRDKNHDGVIEEGSELNAAQKLKTFKALDAMASRSPFIKDETYYDLRERSKVTAQTSYRSADAVTDPKLAKMMIDAAGVSSYQSTTLQEVFEQVDESEVVVRQMEEPRTGRKLLGVDYGAGDNTFGAVFDPESGEMLVKVQDGDFYFPNSATFQPGEDYNALLDRAATSEPKTRYTRPSEVSDPQLAQMMIEAACVSSYQSTNLQEVFDQVDQSEVVVRQLEEPRTHRKLVGIDYGAGDNTYGAVFDFYSGKRVAEVQDGDLSVLPD
ncbi:MAG: hypothetical protein HY901_27355 [Deltaproteobacteria bacterium]|nr:hypothetical protein [Deltaproteobacteria bacterium]